MQYLGGKSKISKEIASLINNVLTALGGGYMRYLGVKSRISTQLSNVVNTTFGESGERVFVSLFCGSCAIESKVNADVKILNDKHPYLIAMWKALQNGWIPPDEISKEQYKYIKEHKDEDMALSGFVGFGCSFGGKWFGGLASNKRGDNYCRRANKSVLKDMGGLQNATFLCLDYKDVEIPQGAIVYADPPYDNTTGYSLGDFDSNEFWGYVCKLSETNIVLISEEKAPDDFVSIWHKEQKRMIDNVNKNIFTRTENLFVHKKYENMLNL